MKIITNLRQLNRQFRKPVVTIGIFDGVHLGHKKILKQVVNEAKIIRGTSMVVTFNPHPKRVLDIIGAPPLLVSVKHRLNLIEKEGLDAAVVLDFDEAFARCDARKFVEKVLVEKIGVNSIILGANFKFGKDRKGDIGLLKSMGRRFGFSAEQAPLFKVNSRPVSSTRIRQLVMSGRLIEALRLLGRPCSTLGTVIKGSRRGRLLGYPTANMNPHHEAIPPSGVYAVYVMVNSKRYKGILNIGTRPTFDKTQNAKEPTIETHIFGFNNSIYGKDIEVIFIKKIREERKFSSKEELIKQIRIDEHTAHMLL